LERLFPDSEIMVIRNRDYACRVFVAKSAFVELLLRRAAAIEYPNFKDSVREDGLHDL
jgi:hypothetical protein